MKSHIGVLISDQVSRAGIRVPASELMAAEERGRIARAANGLPAGTPTHMQHDMHRLIGWTYCNHDRYLRMVIIKCEHKRIISIRCECWAWLLRALICKPRTLNR